MFSNSGINRVFLAGTIVKDPRFHKNTCYHDMVCFQLVTHEQYPGNGKMVDHFETHYIKVPSSILSFELFKDQTVHVEGKIHTESFTDLQNIRRYKTEIIASRVVMLTSLEVTKMATAL
ncbi:single-stranded DNA-binding protein [Mucilaginibacter limnophilus]|nr:single-stranded DNA-binding protein [Mucilaginibacter limnophilus]